MKICAVILAAGEGKRLKSDIPKYKQQLGGWTLLNHSIENAKMVGFNEVCIVMGSGDKGVVDIKDVSVVEQTRHGRCFLNSFKVAGS